MELFNVFVNKMNVITGGAIAIATYLFGKHWYLFAVFLLLNFIDWITGWMKSRLAGKENSSKGLLGIVKKFGYWIMILISFLMGSVFVDIGTVLGINLQVTTLIGWFVLASLIVNEFRSIIENLVEAGYHPPAILVQGLEAAAKAIDKDKGKDEEDS